MKDYLKENLSPSARLFWQRVFVRAVFWCVRVAAIAYGFGRRIVEAAAERGLNVAEAWDVAPRPPRAAEFAPQPFGVRDFLLLTGRREGEQRDAAQAVREPREGREPRASVVIPVFNQAEFTFQCLRSLWREIDADDAEVIVVNNASTDETAELLARFGDKLRVVTNEENRGFVDACNQGASLARGRFIVFLDNDTVVLPGWLDELIATAERDESIGTVGSMLLYPDGRIREAGAIVWKDGAAFHYGWGGAAGDPRYSFARDVDYCSGASLLVRRDLFAQLGGFDRRYAPASYEAADLCFGVRSLGFRVRYQPLARVLHYEGATAGRGAGAGFKHFQPINREKFREKWRAVLEREHLPNDASLAARAANRTPGPYVLVCDDHTPAPDRDAGSARMLFILQTLAAWSRPVFVSLAKDRGGEHERRLWEYGIETAGAVELPRLLREREFRAAVLSRPAVADAVLESIRRADPRVRVVFDTVDVHFVRTEREAAVSGDARIAARALHYRELETRLARATDLVWFCSPEDERAMKQVAPGVRARIVPTVHAPRDRGKDFDDRRDLLFLGNLAHTPNSDAVHFFVREVLPLVRESLPGVRLHIVGDNVPPEIAALASPDVWVHGYVPDIEPFFASCRVMVVPIRFGAGIRGKIGESLAHGLPVVTTSIGAEGLGFTGGAREALVADDARAFADAVARAYTDAALWRQLSDDGYAHVAHTFSPEVVKDTINNSLRETIGLTGDASRMTRQINSSDPTTAGETRRAGAADAFR
ncbi:MAG: glycosyltransferase [Pyrinomonadaceae bacterium]